MSVKIRLARFGRKKRPYYRIVVTNSSKPRDGGYIEKIGHYHSLLPDDNENRIKVNVDRLKYWLSVGAKATKPILKFIKRGLINIENSSLS